MAWTKEQQEAIDSEGKNIIVSAGAGSGKTAVLTARTLRKLKSGTHVNGLLILTFTNAAAAEMKERIRKNIVKTEGLEEERDLIDASYITTFDSFSLSIVKKYHTRLNITNKIKITDEVVISIEKNKILEEILDEYYLNPTKEFERLINNFALKDDKELKTYLLNVYKKIELKYDKEKYLNDYITNTYNESTLLKFKEEFIDLLISYQENIKSLIDDISLYFDGTYYEKVLDATNKLVNAKTYKEFKDSFNEFKLPQVPKNSDEEGKTVKEALSSQIKELKELLIFESEDEILDDIRSTESNAKVIIEILKELDRRLEEYKVNEEIYNFTDIARLAIKVVEENNDIREELIDSFKEILVDEYQDTSDTQEKFISLISNNNVYMVGDIKQSIYRFRNANPYIFKNKYDTYRDTDKGIKIDLVKNFRSRKEVLDNINLLFDLIMDDEIGGADYKASHRMNFGNTSYIEEGKTSQNYNMEIYTYEKPPRNIKKDEQEAFIIGNDILDKVNNKFQVFDKDTKILRDIEYKDFVILLDKSTNFDLYKKIFEYLHIPITILKDEALRKDDDILVIKNLLNLIINVKNNNFDVDFKYNFTSVSRSFLYKTSDEEIYNYFVNNSFKESKLYEDIVYLTKDIDLMTPSTYLDYVLDYLNYDELLLTIGRVKELRVRREYFYNLIKDFEGEGKTIYEFTTYLDSIFDGDYDLKFSINTSSKNSCKIMTIHKSKGLEFPICYFAGFKSKFNLTDLKDKIIYDNKYGIVIPKVDGYYKDTVLKTLLKINTKKEEISEKIRLLYVAVTRAKEKMIFVMEEEDIITNVTDIVPTYIRNKYNSFQSIMKSIYSSLEEFITKKEIPVTKEYLNITNKSNLDELKNNLDTLEVNELSIKEEKLEESHFSKDILHIITKEEQSAMDFGSKVHEAFELLDFKNPNFDKVMLSPSIKEKIKLFLETDLMKENINSNLYKEYEFTYKEEGVISHGIIDLLIEREDKLIILDYKLKTIDDENYDKQLNGYRKALHEKTGKNVECYLYSVMDNKMKEVK